ncbi:hypothetical protein AB0C10_22485 [Microbispora amethystogenes]|uniref:hypothetical protein n=1 Tax=Microbispora amethystogenes TaxID=1427754 RepID=UPI00340185DE
MVSVSEVGHADGLPDSHRAWDEMSGRLPGLFRRLALRRAFDAMPVLDARPEALPDRHLLRASTLLGVFAHAYQYMATDPPAALPESLLRPWTIHRPVLLQLAAARPRRAAGAGHHGPARANLARASSSAGRTVAASRTTRGSTTWSARARPRSEAGQHGAHEVLLGQRPGEPAVVVEDHQLQEDPKRVGEGAAGSGWTT